MKLGIYSDIHLEFRWQIRASIVEKILQEKINGTDADLVINAGDMHPYPDARALFLADIKVPHEHVLGNHDFYGLQKLHHSRFVRDVNGLKVVGATLWTDFDKGNMFVMGKFRDTLADGHQIMPQLPSHTITEEIYELFHRDLDFLTKEKPDVVVTHHAPSFRSVHPRFHASGFVNHYFMSELDDYILDHPHIKLWVHGHMHMPSDYRLGSCRVVANPLGYPGETYKNVQDYQVLVVEV